MTCPHCGGAWTIRIGRFLIWCNCEDAIQKRAEEPGWLFFASKLAGKLERAA